LFQTCSTPRRGTNRLFVLQRRGTNRHIIFLQWLHFETYCVTVDCWSAVNSTHAYGSRPVNGITSVLQCQAACLSDSSCVAIDYDHNNPLRQYCWLMNRRNYHTGASRGITHYVLDRDCTGIILPQYISVNACCVSVSFFHLLRATLPSLISLALG